MLGDLPACSDLMALGQLPKTIDTFGSAGNCVGAPCPGLYYIPADTTHSIGYCATQAQAVALQSQASIPTTLYWILGGLGILGLLVWKTRSNRAATTTVIR